MNCIWMEFRECPFYTIKDDRIEITELMPEFWGVSSYKKMFSDFKDICDFCLKGYALSQRKQ